MERIRRAKRIAVESASWSSAVTLRGSRRKQRKAEETAVVAMESDSPSASPAEQSAPISATQSDAIPEDLGPLEALLADSTISAILVNGPQDVYVERNGGLSRADVSFANESEVLDIIQAVAKRAGVAIGAAHPMLDARLADGQIVNAVIPPLAADGPVLSIRRPHAAVSLDQLVAARTLNRVTASYLTACVRARCSILVAGTNGAGKSTILQALAGCIDTEDRIVTIEDTPELRRGSHRNLIRLEMPTGAASTSRGELITQATRMRPDRIVIGDIRPGDASSMLDALQTEGDGVLASIHAPSPVAALARLRDLVMGEDPSASPESVQKAITDSVDVIVQVGQMGDGSRRIVSIAEPVLTASGLFDVSEIFAFDSPTGRWGATGARPRTLERISRAGIEIPDRIFDLRPLPSDARHAELEAIVARQAVELDELRREVESARKPRTARLAALLAVVDVVDGLARYPIADEKLRGAVALLHKRLDTMLAGIGIESIGDRGVPLDSGTHEVVGETQLADAPPQTVAAVRTRGIRVGGELIRKAKVIATR